MSGPLEVWRYRDPGGDKLELMTWANRSMNAVIRAQGAEGNESPVLVALDPEAARGLRDALGAWLDERTR